MRCVRCGYRLREFEDECPVCAGRDSVAAAWVCSRCGAQNPAARDHCHQCAAPRRAAHSRPTDAKLATFGRRVLAQIIDTVIVLLLVAMAVGAGLVIAPEWGMATGAVAGLTIDRFAVVATMIIGILYHSVLPVVWGGTIGKLVLRMRVVSADGTALAWWQPIVRTAGLVASLVTLGLVFLLVARDRHNQGLHDKLANTLVIRV